MNFSKALEEMKNGNAVFRDGWNGIEAGKIMYVFIVDNDPEFAPFFVFYKEETDITNTTTATQNVWVPSTWDLMAEDWEFAPER